MISLKPVKQATFATHADEEFTFDWTHHASAKANEPAIPLIANYLQQSFTTGSLHDEADVPAFGNLCYKLATYFLHHKNDTERALLLLHTAEFRHTDRHMVHVQMAMAHCKLTTSAMEIKNETKAVPHATKGLKYCDDIIDHMDSEFKSKHKTPPLEAAICNAQAITTRGLIEYELGKIKNAIDDLNTGLKIYEENKFENDHYANMQLSYGMFLSENNQLPEAICAFNKAESYWVKHQSADNPLYLKFKYVNGEFLKSLPQAHSKIPTLGGKNSIFASKPSTHTKAHSIETELSQLQP